MKFKLNNRVIWKDDIGKYPLKGTVSGIFDDDGITIQWDNGRRIHYSFIQLKKFSVVGHIEIDLAYHREIKLNQLGI
jgi:hypothetical protein